MYILGVSGGFKLGYQDAAAVLMHNGKVIAAIEEERISRIKHAPSVFPYYAIREVLGVAKITIHDVAEVATHGITWGDDYRIDVSKFFFLHFGFCPKLSFWHHHDAHAAGAFFSSGFTGEHDCFIRQFW
jgi:carbamoyltransferase